MLVPWIKRNGKAVEDFLVSKNKNAVCSFIALCNFYRKFIDHFANIAKPVIELTKHNLKPLLYGVRKLIQHFRN